MSILTGKILTHYQVLEQIGCGGMGVVYKARDVRLDRTVALKFLPEAGFTDDDFVRFENEARAISSLSHKNIATVHEFEQADDRRFIVLEYLPGGSLKQRIQKQGPLPLDDVNAIARQIAEGLSYAHAKGIIHRDIKSDNIMFGEDGTAKLTDFGLSKIKSLSGMATTGTVAGTLAYMSPEQVQGSSFDQRTDIWSFGVMLYEMLTGKLPFQAELQPSLIYAILTKDPIPLQLLRPDVPEYLQAIVARCLEKDPTKRYQSTEEIILELDAADSTRMSIPKARSPVRYWWIAAIASLLLLTYLFIPHLSESNEVPSVAILYLKNLGPESNEPLSYGITQDLIVDLARAGWIHVAPMNDIMQFKDAKMGLEEIAQRLNVRNVLEGSIFQQDSNFKISAQLVDPKSKHTLWAERYELKVREIPTLQSTIAVSLLKALQVPTSKLTEKEIAGHRTENPEAYDFYLKAKYAFENKESKEDVIRAQSLYRKAIELDSGITAARIGLAETYIHTGEYEQAKQIYTDALSRAEERNEKLNEATCLRGIGLVHWNLGGYADALQFYDRALAITREMADRFGEARILNNVGLVHWSTGKYQEALEYYNGSLKLRQELGDIQGQSQTLGNMGLVYWNQHDYERALKQYDRALMLAEETNDFKHQGATLNNIGLVYWDQGDYQNALNAYDRSLIILQQLGDRKGEAQTVNNLGLLYADLGEYPTALNYYQRAESIHTELGNRKDLAISWDNMGLALTEQGDYVRAMEYHTKSLNLTQEIGARESEASSLQSLAVCYLRQGKFSQAKEYFERSEEIFGQVGDTLGKMMNTVYLALTFAKLNMAHDAMKKLDTVDVFLQSNAHPRDPIGMYWYTAQTHGALGNWDKQRDYIEKAHAILNSRAGKIGDERLRQSYFTKVRTNREITEIWSRMHQSVQ